MTFTHELYTDSYRSFSRHLGLPYLCHTETAMCNEYTLHLSPTLLNLRSVTLEISLTRVVYLTNQQVKSLFIIFILLFGWSVGGVRKGSPWTGP